MHVSCFMCVATVLHVRVTVYACDCIRSCHRIWSDENPVTGVGLLKYWYVLLDSCAGVWCKCVFFYVCVISDCVEIYGCMFRVLCVLRRSCILVRVGGKVLSQE